MEEKQCPSPLHKIDLKNWLCLKNTVIIKLYIYKKIFARMYANVYTYTYLLPHISCCQY